jgi:hypothetical protein
MDSAPGTSTSPQRPSTHPTDGQPVSQPDPRPRPEQPGPEPGILELRIHGIANELPYGALDLPRGEVTQSDGDGLGSFWIPTPAAEARDKALPPGHVHAIRPDVRREAYSWGAMARLGGIPFGGLLGIVGKVAVRLLWAAMVPFGLVNAAYWARRIPEPEPGAHGAPGRSGSLRSG